MSVLKSLYSTLLLLIAFSLGSSFSTLACEDETQAGAGAGIKVTYASPEENALDNREKMLDEEQLKAQDTVRKIVAPQPKKEDTGSKSTAGNKSAKN